MAQKRSTNLTVPKERKQIYSQQKNILLNIHTTMNENTLNKAYAISYKVVEKKEWFRLIILSSIYFLLSFYFFMYNLSLFFVAFGCALAALFLSFKAYLRKARIAYRINHILNPSDEYEILFFSDHFEWTASNSCFTIAYDKVTYIFETERILVLVYVTEYIVLRKEDLTLETYQRICFLLNEKCANAPKQLKGRW
jgi:hypothetical protein